MMHSLQSPLHRIVQVGFCVALALPALGPVFAAEPAPGASTAAAPKTHVLFMGTNLALEKDKKFHPIEDVTARDVIIKPDGKPVEVPLDQNVTLSITDSLKIAGTSVEIADLKAERAYSPATDPFRKFVRAAGLAAGQSAAADLAQGNMLQLEMLKAGAGAQNDASLGAQIAAAQDAVTAAQLESTREVYDVSSLSVAAGTEASQELFDAIRLSFEVTPQRSLDRAYYAVIAQIQERDSKPGHVRVWTYLRSLGRLPAGEKTNVNIFQSGLPRGYILGNCEVHFYDGANEIATNLSRKRVELTDDEALDFRIIEYVGANKGRTLPASPLVASLPSDLRAMLTPAQQSERCYVRIGKDGRVVAVFRDAAGRRPLEDPALESALKTLRFNPALEAGKPVESTIAIKFG